MDGLRLAELACIPPDKVSEFWPHVAPLLEKAISQGDWTLDGIHAALAKDALLWITTDGEKLYAAGVTRIEEKPRGRICNVLACGGGGIVPWDRVMAQLEDYARQLGCAVFRVEGREGWRRVLKDYTTAWITLEKRL